ncbi:MAG: hypothetical protein ABDH37_01895 [Candidatus Hydrothermales bacterium]
MITLFVFFLIKINEIPPLLIPTFASSDEGYIYITSEYGIGIFDKFNFRFKRGIILEKVPKYTFPDPFTGELYVFFNDGELISLHYDKPNHYTRKGFFPNATSFCVSPTTFKVESNDEIKIFDKYLMVEVERDESSPFWWGARSIENFDENEVSFLAPFYFFTDDGEKVNFRVICKDKDFYYACTEGEGVLVFEKNFWRNVSKLTVGTSFSEIRVIKRLENDLIFIGGIGRYSDKKGLIIKNNFNWKRLTRFHFGLNTEDFYCGLSYKNTLILGSFGKIVVYRDGKFVTKNFDKASSIYKFSIEPPILFVATEKGLYLSDIENLDLNEVVKNLKVYSVESTGNYIYIGTDLGLFALKKSNLENVKILDRKLLLDSKINAIEKDKKGNVWVMSDKGFLKVLESSDTFNFFYPIPVPFNPTNYFVQNSMFMYDSLIFVGTYKNGFYIYNSSKDKWEHLFEEGSIMKRTVYTFEVKGDTLFVGTDKGIYLYKLNHE